MLGAEGIEEEGEEEWIAFWKSVCRIDLLAARVICDVCIAWRILPRSWAGIRVGLKGVGGVVEERRAPISWIILLDTC